MAGELQPTERQIEYARTLGVQFDSSTTRSELSELISIAAAKKYPPSELNLRAAEALGVDTSGPVDKRGLFDRIWDDVSEYGREEDLAAWFVYRIIRGCVQGGPDHPDAAGVDSPAVREIAKVLAADPKIRASIKRYDARDVIWFGQWTTPDGMELEGGSKRTAAFKAAAQLIEERLGLKHRNARAKAREAAGAASGSGCGAIIVVLMLVAVAFVSAR